MANLHHPLANVSLYGLLHIVDHVSPISNASNTKQAMKCRSLLYTQYVVVEVG